MYAYFLSVSSIAVGYRLGFLDIKKVLYFTDLFLNINKLNMWYKYVIDVFTNQEIRSLIQKSNFVCFRWILDINIFPQISISFLDAIHCFFYKSITDLLVQLTVILSTWCSFDFQYGNYLNHNAAQPYVKSLSKHKETAHSRILFLIHCSK